MSGPLTLVAVFVLLAAICAAADWYSHRKP